jgi:hypothetical protein
VCVLGLRHLHEILLHEHLPKIAKETQHLHREREKGGERGGKGRERERE